MIPSFGGRVQRAEGHLRPDKGDERSSDDDCGFSLHSKKAPVNGTFIDATGRTARGPVRFQLETLSRQYPNKRARR